jgi:hypothetical protein
MLQGRTGFGRGRQLQRGTAFAAKAGRRSVEVMTGATLNSESGSASFAILIGRVILATTTQTLHQMAPQDGRRRNRNYNSFIDQFHTALQQAVGTS